MMRFPIENGKYEVSPGLRKLDLSREKLFWITDEYEDQMEAKFELAGSRSPIHIAESADVDAIDAMLLGAGGRFLEEHPEHPLQLGYRFGMQIQEDLAIVQEHEGGNRVIYLHVSFPNGWDPATKIGLDFASVHEPVAHFETMAANQDKIVKAMIHYGPFERFAWGVHTESELERINRPDRWEGCDVGAAVLRVERQTTMGFPEYGAALFTIHTMRTPLKDLESPQRHLLAQALDGMDSASRAYKGLSDEAVDRVVAWLAR